MESSVKNVAEKFKAWQKNRSEGYCYDEIGEFADSLTRGDLLEVFVWLARLFPDYRPEYIGGASLEMKDERSESLTTQPGMGSFIEKAYADLNKRIAHGHAVFEEVQRNAMDELFTTMPKFESLAGKTAADMKESMARAVESAQRLNEEGMREILDPKPDATFKGIFDRFKR